MKDDTGGVPVSGNSHGTNDVSRRSGHPIQAAHRDLFDSRYENQIVALDVYESMIRRDLEAAKIVVGVKHEALIDLAKMARFMINRLFRAAVKRGIRQKDGDVKAISTELRSWARTEASLLQQLGLEDLKSDEQGLLDVSDPSRWRRPESLPDDLEDDEVDVEDPIADAADGQQSSEAGE